MGVVDVSNCSSADEQHSRWSEILDENSLSLTVVVFLIVLLSFILTWSSTKLEHIAAGRSEHLTALLHAFYKELMILGIISFLFFILDQFNVLKRMSELDKIGLDANDDSHISELLHVVHLLLFFVGLAYISLVVCALYVSARTRKYWKTLERKTTLTAVLRQLADEEKKLAGCRKFYDFLTRSRIYKLQSSINYHLARMAFLTHERLPEAFDFSRYMQRVSHKVLVLLLELHPTVWLFLIIFVVTNFFRLKVVGKVEGEGKGGFFPLLAFGYVVTLVALVVHLKCRSIARKLGEAAFEDRAAIVELGTAPAQNSSMTRIVADGDDQDYELRAHLFSRHVARFCGCCGASKSRYRALFWFKKPELLIWLMQGTLFGLALYSTLYFAVYLTEAVGKFYIWSVPVALAPIVLMLVFLLPIFLPTYTLVHFVDVTSVTDVIYILREEREKAKERYKASLIKVVKRVRRGKYDKSRFSSPEQAIHAAKKEIEKTVGLEKKRSQRELRDWKHHHSQVVDSAEVYRVNTATAGTDLALGISSKSTSRNEHPFRATEMH